MQGAHDMTDCLAWFDFSWPSLTQVGRKSCMREGDTQTHSHHPTLCSSRLFLVRYEKNHARDCAGGQSFVSFFSVFEAVWVLATRGGSE